MMWLAALLTNNVTQQAERNSLGWEGSLKKNVDNHLIIIINNTKKYPRTTSTNMTAYDIVYSNQVI